MSFQGFPPECQNFFAELIYNNDREWFEKNKANYQEFVLEPSKAFVVAVGEKLQKISPKINYDTRLNGSGSIMKIHRDVRFSKDKTPYHTFLRMIFWEGAGKKTEHPAFYFGMDADNAKVLAGQMYFPKPVLENYREAINGDKSGKEFQKIYDKLKKVKGFEFEGEQSKRVPRGYAADHERADLLCYKGIAIQGLEVSWDVLQTPKAVDTCFKVYQKMAPLQQWLVGING